MKKIPLYVALARTIAWEPGVGEWRERRAERLRKLLDELPSGSGWDLGTKLGENSRPDRIVLFGEFHHMVEGGYDGWTDHEIHVTASMTSGFDLRITGRNRNDIKDYLHDLFHEALSMPVWECDYATHGGFVVEDRDGEPVEVVWEKASEIWRVYGFDPRSKLLWGAELRGES
jgi:hypothetical protein